MEADAWENHVLRPFLSSRHKYGKLCDMNKRNSDWYIPPNGLAGLIPFLVMAVVSMLGSMLLPVIVRLKTADMRALYSFGLGAGILGVILLFVARLPLYKQRRFLTIGPMKLDREHRRIYWLAYVLVAASLLLFGIVWLRAHEA
jgi:hypothetical protein